jgi:glutamine amidotransferase-like uncharacterized protein
MANESLGCSMLRRSRKVVGIALLAFGATVIGVTWSFCSLTAVRREQQERLIDSFAESVSAANNKSTSAKVALFDAKLDDGSATKDLERFLRAESNIEWKPLSPAQIHTGDLDGFDVLVVPGGSSPKQAETLGEDGKQAIRRFVQSGGGYVGICGGAFLATAKYDCGMALLNARPLIGKRQIPGKGIVSMAGRRAGTVTVELTDAGRRVFHDSRDLLHIRYSGGPILSPADVDDLPQYVSLAVFRTEIWEYQPQQGTMVDTPAIIAGRFGKGRVILFSPHPEMTPGLEFLVREAIRATATIDSADSSKGRR